MFSKLKTSEYALGTKTDNASGFSIPELVIVVLIIAIIAVFALPQLSASRQLLNFSAMRNQIAGALRDARQTAITQREPITFQFDDNNKRVVLFGGNFGALGDSRNKIVNLFDSGISTPDITYGRPASVSTDALGDGTQLTALSSGVVNVTFEGDGSVRDGSDNPIDKALFIFHNKIGKDTAFAVSILGTSGRIKTWRYNAAQNRYVE